MEDTLIVQFLFESIGSSVETFVDQTSSTIISVLGPLAAALFGMYVLLWGCALASGQISEPFSDGMKRIIRMAFVIALAMTVGVYQNVIASTFKGAPLEIAQLVAFPGAPAATDDNALAALLDDSLGKGFEVASEPWEAGVKFNDAGVAGITGEGLALQSMAVILCLIAIITVCVAAGIIFVAYIAMAILLGLGPLFVLFAVFPTTQRWTEAWLGQVVNYAVLFVLVATTVNLLFSLLSAYYVSLSGTAGALGDPSRVIFTTLKAIGLSVAIVGVLLQLNSIATGIAGGAAIQTANVASRLTGMGLTSASAGRAGAGNLRSALGHARATYRGWLGLESARFPRTSRELAHAGGTSARAAANRARQVFRRPTTVEGTQQ